MKNGISKIEQLVPCTYVNKQQNITTGFIAQSTTCCKMTFLDVLHPGGTNPINSLLAVDIVPIVATNVQATKEVVKLAKELKLRISQLEQESQRNTKPEIKQEILVNQTSKERKQEIEAGPPAMKEIPEGKWTDVPITITSS